MDREKDGGEEEKGEGNYKEITLYVIDIIIENAKKGYKKFMISPHTFELRKEVDKETFYEHRNKVKDKKNYNTESDKDFSYLKNGVTVWYHKTQYRKWIKLHVNPSKLLGLDDLTTLWEPSKMNINEMILELEKFMDEYFDSEYVLNDFLLSRIDLTKNIRLGNREIVSAFISFLHNIKKVKGFSPKYSKMDKWYDEDLGFDLKGVSNGVDFTAYDKEAEVRQNIQNMTMKRREIKERIENAKGVLRIEVKLTSQKAIRNYTDEEDTTKRLIKLSKNSEKIFMDTMLRVVPFGDVYKKDQSVKIIEDNVDDKRLKTKMLRLLELVPKKKSLHLAIREMNDRHISHILSKYHSINLSPVTISKRQKMKKLKSLYTFF